MYFHVTTFELYCQYGFFIEPVSFMYLVSLVTQLCGYHRFLSNILRQGSRKDSFSSLESKHSNFLTWER